MAKRKTTKTEPKYAINQMVLFANDDFNILKVEGTKDGFRYYCKNTIKLSMWLPENQLSTDDKISGTHTLLFNQRTPHVLVVDDFYKTPDDIRQLALVQNYTPNLNFYKGQRTTERFLWPFLKEEFEKLLGKRIMDWLNQPCNGCFQTTGFNDPLVYHSDSQSYAAAIYLTPNAPMNAGTSFWRDKTHGCRRPTGHPLEFHRFQNDAAREAAGREIYTEYNILHSDNWELVDKVGAVYNRLVIWDAKLTHSASSYEGLESDTDKARLVQLFFFTVN